MGGLDERYDAITELGRGATSVVYRAIDRRSGAEVAIKHLALTDGPSRLMLRHEFFAMRRLAHPHLVKAYELGEADGREYVVMELVGGDGAPEGPLKLSAFERWMTPLCRAVGHLHANGLVHGDLKPDNVRLDAEGALRLLDMGFLERAGAPGRVRGTPGFMAPEVYRGVPADPRSDVFALGAIAYAWLAGHRPFEAGHALGWLHAAETPPARLDALRPEMPSAVASAVADALSADPARRPASAGHLLERLGFGEAEAGYLVFGAAAFGRDAEREALRAHLDAQLAGAEAGLQLVGAPGTGRTRLMGELASPTAPQPALAAAGRGDAPYGLLTELLLASEPLMTERGLVASDPAWAALRALVPAWGPPPAPLEGRAQESRLSQALVVLLGRLSAGAGVVVALDDWDMADAESRSAIAPVLARPGDGAVAWVVAMRPEAASDAMPRLDLRPLDDEAIGALVASAIDAAPGAGLVAAVAARAEGSPTLTREILALWVKLGALKRINGLWVLDEGALGERAGDLGAQSRDRLAALGPDALALAFAGAVLGREFGLEDAAALAGVAPFGALADLEAEGVLSRDRDRLRFQGLMHEAAIALLPSETARALHLAAAGRYPGADLASRARAARHRLRAGDATAAADALATARRALAAGAVATAGALLEAVERLGGLSPAERLEVASGLADVVRMRGDSAEAAKRYGEAIALAEAQPGQPGLGRLRVSAGVAALVLSRDDEARAHLEAALPLCRAAGDGAEEARALMTLGRIDYFAGRPDAAREAHVRALALAEAAGATSLQADAASFLGAISPPNDPEGRARLAEALALQQRVGNPIGLIEASINLGDRLIASGEPAAAEAVLEQALTTARQIGSRQDEVFVRLNLAQAALDRGRPAAAEAHAKAAIAEATALAQAFPAGFGHVLAALAAHAAGRPAEADQALADGLAAAERTQASYLLGAARLAEAQIRLETGDLAAAATAAEAARKLKEEAHDQVGLARVQVLEARRLTLSGQLDEAEAHLEAARRVAAQEAARGLDAATRVARSALLAARGDWAGALEAATEGRRSAVAAGAAGLGLEADVAAGRALEALGRVEEAREAFAAADAAARELGWPLWEGLAAVALGRLVAGREGAEARARGEASLRSLARAIGRERFEVWPERRLAVGGAPDDIGAGLAEAVSLVADVRRAADLDDLLARLLERAMAASRAEAGALFTYEALQLAGVATQFLKPDDVLEAPELDAALWERQATTEGPRWAFPLVDGDAVIGVLLLESAEPSRQAVVSLLAEGLAEAIAQFTELQRFSRQAERLAFSEDLALRALAGESARAIVRDGLAASLRATGAERALVLKAVDAETLVPAMGLDARGAELGAEAPFSRSVSRWVASTRETVRLLDAQQAEGWQNQQSILALGLRTLVATPLVSAGEVVGVLYVDSGDVVRMLGEREQGLLEAAATIIGPLSTRL